MKTNKKRVEILEYVKINVRIRLSALWVALMICYIYADFFSLYRPGQIDKIISGLMGPFPVTQAGLLIASLMMAVPAVMVFLSLILKPKVSRWANIILGVLYTVIGVANLIGEAWAYYIFFGIIEIVLTLLVVFYGWKWPKQEA